MMTLVSKDVEFSCASFDVYESLSHHVDLPNAHTKVKKCIFDSQSPGNWFEFVIIETDFWSSTIRPIQIQDSCAEFKNPKIPGIQPSDIL